MTKAHPVNVEFDEAEERILLALVPVGSTPAPELVDAAARSRLEADKARSRELLARDALAQACGHPLEARRLSYYESDSLNHVVAGVHCSICGTSLVDILDPYLHGLGAVHVGPRPNSWENWTVTHVQGVDGTTRRDG